jgi:quercetin dioxygenase-like cupin family protein
MATTPETQMQKRAFTEPDELRPAGRGRGEIVMLDNKSFARVTLEPGWRWSTDVKPITHTHSCQAVHTGVVLSGRIHLVMDDGSEMEFGEGDVYHIPAGHDAWVVGDETYVGVDVVSEDVWAKPAE